jgi:hypothetical protein
MPDAAILHRLYTNAAEDGDPSPARGRVVEVEGDASRVLSKNVLAALDDLLAKTSPATTRTGWVVRRFVDGPTTYGCVIASHGDLVKAGDERDGVLNHARLVAIDGPAFDASALVEAAHDFPEADVCAAPAGQRLRAYVDAVSSETSTLVRPVTVGELQDAPLLQEMLLASVATLQQTRIAVKIPNGTVETLAHAWAALPLALQVHNSWAVGVKNGCPVNVLVSTSDGQSPAQLGSKVLNDHVKQYVGLMRGAPDAVSAMLANPALGDANAFADAIRRSAVAPELRSVAGKEEMSRKRNEPWQPLDEDSRAEVNRQLKAAAEVMRRETDDRLRTFEEKIRSQSQSRKVRNALLPMWIAIGVLTLAVAYLGYRSFAVPVKAGRPDAVAREAPREVDEDQPVREEPEVPALSPARQAVARAEASNQWAEELKALLDNDSASVAAMIDDLARSSSNAPLAKYGERVGRGEDLGVNGRDQLRALLVDALAAAFDAKVKVDGKLADVNVGALKQRYGVGGTNSDPASKALQSEVLLRWIAEHER